MVEDLIETLEASKIEYGSIKGRGFDFEAGLVKSYSELLKTMQCQRNNILSFLLAFSCILSY